MDYNSFIKEISDAFMDSGLVTSIDTGEKYTPNGNKDAYICIIERNEPKEIIIFLKRYYLLYYYEEYSLSDIINLVLLEHLERRCCLDIKADLIKANKYYIIYQVVNYEKNKEWLGTVPYFKYHDLAVIFTYYINNLIGIMPLVPITSEIYEKIDIEKNDLYQLAADNLERLYPAVLQRIDYPSNVRLIGLPRITAYVFSNAAGRYGSFYIAHAGILKKVADALHTSYYLLPASIHYLILIPDEGVTLEIIFAYLNDARADKSEDEFLSSMVYYYDSSKAVLTMHSQLETT